MQADVLRRNAADERRSTIAWAVALALLAVMYLALYPAIQHSGIDLQKLFQQMPASLRDALLGPNGDYLSPTGYVGTELFSFMLPVLFLAATLTYASRTLAAEESGGTIDVLLATPISRRRLVVDKALAAMLPVFALAVVVWVVVAAVGPPVGITVNLAFLAEGLLALALVACAFGMLALLVTAFWGSRAAGAGIAAGAAVLLFALNAVAPSVSALKEIARLSPFHWAGGPGVLHAGVDHLDWVPLVLAPVLLLAVAVIAYEHRDLSG